MRWTRAEAQRIDQVPLRHAVVRVGMVRRHRALVAPPQLDAIPRDVACASRAVEQALRRRAAGQRDVKRCPPSPRRATRSRRPAACASASRSANDLHRLRFDVAAELEPHRRQHLLGERVVLPRAKPREQRRRDHVGGHRLFDRRHHRPAALARVLRRCRRTSRASGSSTSAFAVRSISHDDSTLPRRHTSAMSATGS